MKWLSFFLSVPGLAFILGGVASGCASTLPSTASRPTYLAQSLAVDCKPGESSVVCCIKKFPLTAAESCGASASEAAEVLNGARVLNEGAKAAAHETVPNTGEDDDPDEGWKQHCIDTYVACKNQKGWVGNCYECFRNCEGQREWPFHLCTRKGKVR